MMEWSEMLPEVLDIIAQKHITCYEHYPSFACVCKSWRLAAVRTYHNSNGPPSRLPCLMLAENSRGEHLFETEQSRKGFLRFGLVRRFVSILRCSRSALGNSYDQESRELLLLSNKSIRKIRLREVYGKVYRSSCGWLLTVGKDFGSQIINPLSLEIINLPNVDTFPETSRPLQWDYAMRKVLLLLESKLVFVIWGWYRLGFCHIGENKWTSVEQGWVNDPISDITFYHGQVYTFNSGNQIQACNVNGKGPAVLFDVATIPQDVYNGSVFPSYIVGLDDGDRKQLLVIISGFNFDEMKLKSFQVLAYDLESENWSKVTDIGTKTLFVGYTSSSFWVEDTTGTIKGNCIYYINGVTGDMGIYHLLDGTIEPHYIAGESHSRVNPPMWLQSM